jgi:hypothetical protein
VNDYVSLSPALRALILEAKSAINSLDRANSGSFATAHAMDVARASAWDLQRLMPRLLKELGVETLPQTVVPLKRRGM